MSSLKITNKIKKISIAVGLTLALLAAIGAGFLFWQNRNTAANTDWDYISGKGKMVIGITYYAPMNYLDGDKLVGFETEFATAVCEELGVEPVFQEIDWNSKEVELASKNIDALWNGMTKTAERAENMDFSVSYLRNRPVMIAAESRIDRFRTADSLADAVVAVEKGSMAEEIAKSDQFFASAKIVAVDTQVKAFLEIKAGTADVVVGDYVMAIGSLGEGTDFADLAISDYKVFESEEYAIGFRKNSPETVGKVNQAIAGLIADGTLQKIADKYKLGDLLIK
jgi:polar amino acid transport system substrate-binding protein